MKVDQIIFSDQLKEDELINIKGGLKSDLVAQLSKCSSCNCFIGNENTKKDTEQSIVHP
jgi:hypothetical protein